jgi:cardiolipin synthase
VRIIASAGGDDSYEIHDAYLTAVEHAQHRIWITQAYFVPSSEILESLAGAARRGVDVRVLVPGLSNSSIALAASRASYADLLDAGVRIYERQDAMIHAKTAVIDTAWSTVGSSNFDYRSFVHNHEANAVVVGRRFAWEMEELFRIDLEHAEEIDQRQWDRRPLNDRIVQRLCRLFAYWL